MSIPVWMEMPVSEDTLQGKPARPKHMIKGNALLVYRNDKVYVAVRETDTVDSLLRQSDVRQLTADEAHRIEDSLPGIGAAKLNSLGASPADSHSRYRRLGLGDLVSRVTSRLGIPECDACGRRKKRLNGLTVWRTRRSLKKHQSAA
jgi:hypothetical protein